MRKHGVEVEEDPTCILVPVDASGLRSFAFAASTMPSAMARTWRSVSPSQMTK
jgi:hypothetical protein